jgi:CheY-like chemotaxis protein
MAEHGTITTGSPRTPTIMVVDDDAVTLKLCATYLEAAGYSVLTADGSSEAQHLCDTYRSKIDLIILDLLLYPPAVQMDHHTNTRPRVHGDKLLSILRMKRPLARVLLVSATPPQTIGARGMGRLVRQHPFLQKPFTRDVLCEKVQQLLAVSSNGQAP